MRELTPDDLDWVVEVTRLRRNALEPHAPRFWRPAADATERHRAYLGHLIEDPDTLGVRTDHGYLLGLDRDTYALVDDMVVLPDEHWPTDGVALLRHANERLNAVRFVVPVFESPRLHAACAAGLAPVETWWLRNLDPVGGLALEGDEIEVPGASGRLVSAPPVYDPGGQVLLVTEVQSAAALTRIERAAAARGATVSVVTQRPADYRVASLLTSAGYVVATHFCS